MKSSEVKAIAAKRREVGENCKHFSISSSLYLKNLLQRIVLDVTKGMHQHISEKGLNFTTKGQTPTKATNDALQAILDNRFRQFDRTEREGFHPYGKVFVHSFSWDMVHGTLQLKISGSCTVKRPKFGSKLDETYDTVLSSRTINVHADIYNSATGNYLIPDFDMDVTVEDVIAAEARIEVLKEEARKIESECKKLEKLTHYVI